MQDARNETLSGVLRWVLEAAFAVGVAVILALRYVLGEYYGWLFGGDERYFNCVLTVMYVSGASALVILRQLIAMFKTISRRNPFVKQNVSGLKIIAVCCFVIAAAFLGKCFFYVSLISMTAVAVFVTAGLAALVLGGLFGQAVSYKSENDLTI